MDNIDWGRTQLLLFTIVQCEGAINYYNEDGNTRDYGSNYQYIHLDRQRMLVIKRKEAGIKAVLWQIQALQAAFDLLWHYKVPSSNSHLEAKHREVEVFIILSFWTTAESWILIRGATERLCLRDLFFTYNILSWSLHGWRNLPRKCKSLNSFHILVYTVLNNMKACQRKSIEMKCFYRFLLFIWPSACLLQQKAR